MKKMLILTLIVSALSLPAFAQKISGKGEITLNNGKTTIGISIGDESTDGKKLVNRVRTLERAVRDLQLQVYNLTLDDLEQEQSLYECSYEAFSKIFYGEGETKAIAKSNARKKCLKKHSEMHCDFESCDQLK